VSIIDADQAVTAAAARLKLDHGLPYADCFAAVAAGRMGVLVTADPDFKRIRWLRILALPRHQGASVKRATR
jgi:predicted nucleic acid-binding protein